MSLESLFKLSILVNMIDRVSGPAKKINSTVNDTISRFNNFSKGMADMARDGVVLMGTGQQLVTAALSPVKATFETQDALGELASLGIEDLGALENAATKFSSTWAGTTKPQFLTAAYDIKSGIASLNDEGVAGFTSLAGVTAKATKATIGTMTDLFATGYGIYKDYYSNLTDMEFGEMFSAGIADSVRAFKTSGSGMAQAISSLGGSATAAQVPLEEQLAILGMLQATMSGSEAGTKYTAFLGHAAKAGEELGLSFTDASGQLKSMPEILGAIKGKFGDVLTAGNKLELQKAFGTIEAVKLIDLLYSKTGDLEKNITGLYDTMGKGMSVTEEMANKINAPPGQSWVLFQQKMQATLETVGNAMLPQFMKLQEMLDGAANKLMEFTNKHPNLISNIMYLVMAFGVFLTALGLAKLGIGGVGTILLGAHKIAGIAIKGFKLAKDAIFYLQYGFFLLKPALLAIKSGFLSATSAAWAFIAPLLANPITWIVLGIIALIAVIVLLVKHWDKVTAAFKAGFDWLHNKLQGVPDWVLVAISAFAPFIGIPLLIVKHWDTFKAGVKAAIDGVVQAFDWLKQKFAELPLGVQLLIAAFFPFIGLPMLIISHWGQIKDFFTNLPENIMTAFNNFPGLISGFFEGLGPMLMESGAKIMLTIANGIWSAISAPVEAVAGAFQKVRQLLPFSDAKEGSLSELTLSGRRIFETINTGMEQSAGLPSETMGKAFSEADDNISAKAAGSGTSLGGNGSTGRRTVIQNLILKVDLDKIDSLDKLKKLIHEIEDGINGDDPDPEPQPIF